MPYAVRRRGKKWVVLNPKTGRVYGTHDSKEQALGQQRALYVNAPPGEEKAAPAEYRVIAVPQGLVVAKVRR